jgi:hypothetical protein
MVSHFGGHQYCSTISIPGPVSDHEMLPRDRPPYGLNLSPYSFCLFGYLKMQRINHKYASHEEVKDQATELPGEPCESIIAADSICGSSL